jgi:endonuclease YncB( thermonuclease family)
MSTKLKIQIAVAFLLFIIVTVAHGKLEESMNRPPTVPDNVVIVEGDRLELDGARIRLFGIDAPELAQDCGEPKRLYPCGREAKAALETLFLKAANIACEKKDEDQDGWTLAVCRVNGLDVGRELVKNGQALADRYYSFAYSKEEEAAKQAGRGLWASAFLPPWEWRKAR